MTDKKPSGIPHTAWPKPYLLSIYEKAVEEGCCRIDMKGDREKAQSLTYAFYRLRRRSDSQHAAFIKPEYHLVTCTWEADRGTILVTYSALPDGHELPSVESVEGALRHSADPQLANPLPVFDLVPEPASTSNELNVEAFMQNLLEEAGERIEHDDKGVDSLG